MQSQAQLLITPSCLSILRAAGLFMRSIATLVILTFTMMILTPTVAAARQVRSPQAKTLSANAKLPLPSGDEAQLSAALQATSERLGRLQQRLQEHPADNVEDDLNALQNDKTGIDALNTQVLANFAAIETQLRQKNVSSVILQRHTDVVRQYQAELAQLTTELEGIRHAPDNVGKKNAVSIARQHLQDKAVKRRQQPFDPKDLPNQILKAKGEHKPKETKQDFSDAGLYSTPNVQLATLGDYKFDKLKEADTPLYLAETDEVVLTQVIKDKAAALNYDPVKIYHFVRNTIEWQPTWGGIQNAELTLNTQSGNAMDIASLTIALLRASKIPARYVHGTIDVPIEKFNNWAGGFTDTNSALQYAQDGGIPLTAIVNGGSITKVRMEHVWVEAAIDYFPSRGAKNREADSWIPIDTSYKNYNYTQPINAMSVGIFDPQNYLNGLLNNSTINNSDNSISNINIAYIKQNFTAMQSNLSSFITNKLPSAALKDIVGGKDIISKESSTLPNSLQNKIIVKGATYGSLPEYLQQKINYAFEKNVNGELINNTTLSYAVINNKKITLSFRPATNDDEKVLQAFFPKEFSDINQLDVSIPSYLVYVVPELKIDDIVIKTGTPVRLGDNVPFFSTTEYAGRGILGKFNTYRVVAGSYLAIHAYAGNVSEKKSMDLKTKFTNQLDLLNKNAFPDKYSREEYLGDSFYAIGLSYYLQMNYARQLLANYMGCHAILANGIGSFGYEPKVNIVYGIPLSIQKGRVVMDAPIASISAANDGKTDTRADYTLKAGIISSLLESLVPDRIFNASKLPDQSFSTATLLLKANELGQKIFVIRNENKSAVIDKINLDTGSMEEINNALNAGKYVITHENIIRTGQWTGAGYIIYDPTTGVGSYMISGGVNGDETVANDNGVSSLALALSILPSAQESMFNNVSPKVQTAFILIYTVKLITLFNDAMDKYNCGFVARLVLSAAFVQGVAASAMLIGLVSLPKGAAGNLLDWQVIGALILNAAAAWIELSKLPESICSSKS